MENSRLSIIIPMYNSCANVVKNLTTLDTQRAGKGYDLEVLVLNDGSKEDTTLVEMLCKNYGFTYYSHENMGGAATCNRGLSLVSGDYFTFIDADDSITDIYLDVIFNEIESGEYDFITHRWKLQSGIIGDQHELPLVNWNVWSNVYRTEIFNKTKFDEDIIFAWDIDWLRRLPFTPDTPILCSAAITNIYNESNPESTTNKFYRGEIPARKSDIQK